LPIFRFCRIVRINPFPVADSPGTLINGDFVNHYAQHIHAKLYAKALVMASNTCTIALVVVDICAMQKDFLDEVKQRIFTETGIEPAHIMISSTHTHAAGSVASLLLGAVDLAYRARLPALIVDAVKRAQHRLKPAQLAFGAVDAPEHVLCRRYLMDEGYQAMNPVTGALDLLKTNPFGAESAIIKPVALVDPQLSFIGVKTPEGKWISLLGNYSLHYVGDWPNGTISPDYFGVFSNAIQEGLDADDDFVGMMSNGTSGDVNIWDFKNADRYPTADHEKSKMIGEDLAAKVMGVLSDLYWDTDPVLGVLYRDLNIAVRKPSAAALKRAAEIVKAAQFERILEIGPYQLEQIYTREQLLLSVYPAQVKFPLQVFKLGSGVIAALGGEFFSETGLWLKKHSQIDHYFTITMANDYTGYVPPAHEIENGGYETWHCRTSYFDLQAELKIKTELLDLIRN
jgi:neutral ceramidase